MLAICWQRKENSSLDINGTSGQAGSQWHMIVGCSESFTPIAPTIEGSMSNTS